MLVSVIEALAERDPSFLEKFASLPRHGNKRRYVARDRNDLYPDRPDLVQKESHQLRSGYWLSVHWGRKSIERILTIACGVAGLRYGTDLKINFWQ